MTIASTEEATSSDNALLNIILQARRNGKDYVQIEAMYSIPAPRAEAMVKAHYAGKTANIDPNEYRMLQLDRLEGLIDVMQSMAQMGNVKSAETLLKLLEQINELLGLNLQATKTEIRIITDEQSTVVFQMMKYVLKNVLEYVGTIVTDQKQLAIIEDQWDEKVNVSWAGAIEEIVDAELVES